MSGCANNGAKPKWTNEQYLEALHRVNQLAGVCGIKEYRQHKRTVDPTPEAVVSRFGSWNRAKIEAGLRIQVRIKRDGTIVEEEEVELPPVQRTTYPCHICHKPFQGIGKRKGEWFCEGCRTSVTALASGMGC